MSEITNININDLSVGDKLTGEVKNIVDFGAFVNIGLENEALLHISKMSDEFVRDPRDVVSSGQVIEVTIDNIDLDRNRVGLTLKG